MNIRKLLIATFITATGLSYAQSAIDNPITKAMLDVYQQELNTNPQNYEIYFRRANEYYNLNQYLRALSDVDNAIKYTPADDTDLLFQEYSLRATIYQMTDRQREALSDLNEAFRLDPTSYTTLYLKANTEYELGMYQEAKADYQRLQRYNQRSLEALIGLARIAIKENNLGQANDYADQAVALSPAQSDVYVRRANVRRLMGNNNGAVDDLLVAVSIDKDNTTAISELVAISNSDYNAVILGLGNAIQQAPQVGMFYYMRAIIAMSHYHYKAAIDDFNTIIDQNLYNYHGIYGSLAECYYGLGQYQQALNEINQALSMTADNGIYYITRAKIRRAMNEPEKALESAATALDKLPGNIQAIIEKGLCEVSSGHYEEASSLFGEAVMDDPATAYQYVLRAWTMDSYLKQHAGAITLYNRMLDLEYPAENVKSLRGFALIALDRNPDAIAWMENILENVKDVDGSLHYYAACLFSHIGMTDRAFDCMETSLELGYADYYNWTGNNDATVNVAPMRDDARFNTMLARFDYLFK